MDLKDKIAEKLGISVEDLITAIHSDIDSNLAVMFIPAIILVVSTFITAGFVWLISEGEHEFSDFSKVYRIYFCIGGPVGFCLLMYAIKSATAYDSLVFNRLVDLAKSLGIL